jgi:hypothetical protein
MIVSQSIHEDFDQLPGFLTPCTFIYTCIAILKNIEQYGILHPKCILINISEKQFSGPTAQSLSSCQFVHPFSTQKKHTWKAILWIHSPKFELILICSSSAQLVNLVYEYQHLMAITLTFPSIVIRNLFSVLMKPDTFVSSKSFKVHLPFLWLINIWTNCPHLE